MDQIKIGKFISEKRKERKITQSELAEKLNISNRAVSKWENGNSLPDASIMVELCNILNISINDLFSGEVVDMKNNEKKLEENLIEVAKQKEEKDKQLLNLEVLIGVISTCSWLLLLAIVKFIKIDESVKLLIIIPSTIFYIAIIFVLLMIEQIAGYYECKYCHHKYIPSYFKMLFALHFGRTRYLKCPKCNKKSWNKKSIV